MGIFAVDGKFARFLNCLGNLIVLNILTIICSIPIVTFGASMTALYTMTMRIVRKEEGNLFKGYFQAFKDNFKQATVIWLTGGGIMAFMAFDIWLLRSVSGSFGLVYRALLFVIILVFAMVLIHAFAVLARFENTTKNTVKNAVLFCVGRLPLAILMLAVTLIPLALLTVSYRFFSVDFLIGIAGPAYLTSVYFTDLFERYCSNSTATE